MKLLVLCALVAVAGVVVEALATPKFIQDIQDAQNVQLLRYDSDNGGLGTYSFANRHRGSTTNDFKFLYLRSMVFTWKSLSSYEQSDGSRRDEQGELRNAGAEDEFVAVKGSFSWIGPDGANYTVNYVADENGYQPTFKKIPFVG